MRVPALILLLFGLLTTLSSAASQDADQGLIVEGNPVGEANLGSLNPLLCDNPACLLLTRLLFPSLLRIDASTQTFAPATATDGLAESWTINGDTVTFRLHSDRVWSDGTPITAYDVYFSYAGALSDQVNSPYKAQMQALIRAVAPLDASTFAVVLKTPNCDLLDQLNLPIIPAHLFAPDLANVGFAGGDLTGWYDAQPRNFSTMLTSSFNDAPTVTAGQFRFDSRSYDRDVRLISSDGKRGFEYLDATDADETVDRFLRGEITLLVDPPYNRRQDIRAANGVTVIERPGNITYSIRLNFADPNHPAGDRDEDGNRVDQGRHPILTDPAVVRAMQMAIDRQALIDALAEGDGVALAGSLPPASWAYDGAQPVAFDRMGAARLLESAGWKDTDGDGIRECITCKTAEHNSMLYITLIYNTGLVQSSIDDSTIAGLISQQMRKVGIQVDPSPFDDVTQVMTHQSFEAALVSDVHVIPDAPDQSADFTAAGDVLNIGQNVGSYRNDSLTDLFDQALHAPTCDLKTRAALYTQAQQVMRDSPPAIWLFSPNRMIAVRGDARTLQPLVEEMLP